MINHDVEKSQERGRHLCSTHHTLLNFYLYHKSRSLNSAFQSVNEIAARKNVVLHDINLLDNQNCLRVQTLTCPLNWLLYTPTLTLFGCDTNPVHLSCKERKSRTVILLLLLCTSVYKSGIQLIWLRSNHSQGVTGLTASHQNFKAVFQIPFWLKICSKPHRQSTESRPDIKESSTALRAALFKGQN